MSDFTFINCLGDRPGINSSDRRKIKRHVMREIGLSRRRPQPHGNGKDPAGGSRSDSDNFEGSALSPKSSTPSSSKGLLVSRGGKAVGVKFGHHDGGLTSKSPTSNVEVFIDSLSPPVPKRFLRNRPEHFLETLHHYSVTAKINVVVMKDIWFTQTHLDSVTLHCAFSMLTSWVGVIHPPIGELPNHRLQVAAANSRAIQSIQRRISNPATSCSEAVVAAIVAIICYAITQDDDEQAGIHFAGLKTIINARGGIHTLRSNFILQCLVSFVDVLVACYQNCVPAFELAPFPDLHDFCQEAYLPDLTFDILRCWVHKYPSHLRYSKLFYDLILYLSRLRQDVTGKIWLNSIGTAGSAVTLFHGFQSEYACSLDGTSGDVIIDCVRVAIPLALSEPRRRMGIYPSSIPKFMRDLRAGLQSKHADWTGIEKLRLWLLTVGATQGKKALGTWFEDELLQTVQCLPSGERLASLRDVQEMVLHCRQESGSAAPMDTDVFELPQPLPVAAGTNQQSLPMRTLPFSPMKTQDTAGQGLT